MSSGGGARRPNAFLLVLDALRADAVEPYGAPQGSSPALAQLAARGVAVDGVRSTASWTLPSHTAMFTGTLARGLGLGQAPGGTPAGAAPVVRAQRDRLLAEVLRRAGYVTHGLSANFWASPHAGFGTGFDSFDVIDPQRQTTLSRKVSHRLKGAWEAIQARVDDGARAGQEVVSRWLAEADERPFFWFANLIECHSPYLPPGPYHGASVRQRVHAAQDAQRYLTFDAIVRACIGAQRVPDAALRRMRRLYAASVRYADAWVANMVSQLREAGVLENTLIVVCSDHGENLGEGGRMAHALAVDERLLRVPLIAAGPGAETFEGMRSLVELPARIAEALGVTEHPWSASLPSGLPVAQWDSYGADAQRIAELTARWRLDEESVHRLTMPLTCAVSGHLKLVRGADPADEALYDLAEDPGEQTPITDQQQMRLRAGAALADLRAAVNHPSVQATAAVTPAPAQQDRDEVADLERRMRQLGYM